MQHLFSDYYADRFGGREIRSLLDGVERAEVRGDGRVLKLDRSHEVVSQVAHRLNGVDIHS